MIFLQNNFFVRILYIYRLYNKVMTYVPIKDANNIDICSVSGDSNVVPKCTDHELYRMEEVILKQLNQFNLEYSNYRIFLDNNQHSSRNDGHAMYNYIGSNGETMDYNSAHNLMNTQFSPIAMNPNANASNLPSYAILNQNLNTYKDVISTYNIHNPNPIDSSLTGKSPAVVKNNNSELSNRDPTTYLKPRHDEIQKLRSDLDQKLMDLNNTSNGMYSSSKLQMDSNIYITIMWTTLASAIVYYSFFHL
jgi:hypothetical protein